MLDAWRWSPTDRILHVLPLHHVHGVVNVLTCALASGATCEFIPQNRVKQDLAEAIWERWMNPSRDLTLFMAVPTIYAKLAQAYEKQSEKRVAMQNACSQFRLMVSGSAALPESVFNKWEEISGHRLLERYGMTEIGMALGNPLDGPRVPGTVGLPFPGVHARIFVPDVKEKETVSTWKDITESVDAPGELFIRGPQVFKEYWGRPDATKETFYDLTKDGSLWFRTGDIAARTDTGYFKILGRASVDIIKTGGYKISALEIERELLEHPSVLDVAVVGIPDGKALKDTVQSSSTGTEAGNTWGERVGAMVVFRKGAPTPNLTDLRQFLRDRLAPHKIPSILLDVKELPRNAMGKVNKKDLLKYFVA
ncbi:Acyl-CoA synthetase member 3, mitochondrial [Quaeritorhiza haematococci]|nr:Acyl-CoA synthetase member 3, mitochondrial [Quaeritorhiza haematococci]